MKIESIINRVQDYDYVSFDIFDTLLKRDVSRPADVFEIVERRYSQNNSYELDFKTKRMNAEKMARDRSVFEEITLDEIYDYLDIDKRIKEELKILEMKTESQLIIINSPIKRVYDWCVDNKKTIYIVSDMYLSKRYIENLLYKKGVVGYKGLYLSSELKCRKRTGHLFLELLEKEDIDKKKIIHIGDSLAADYLGAKMAGIHAIHIKRHLLFLSYSNRIKNGDSLGKRTLYAFMNNRVSGISSRPEKIGYEVLGPIIYGYSKWIHERILSRYKDNKTVVWFAARDMYIFYQAYKIIYGSDQNVKYIYISRKSLRPILTTVTGDLSESGKIFPCGKYPLEEILLNMGYSAEIIQLIDKNVLNCRYDVRRLNEDKILMSTLESAGLLLEDKGLSEFGLKYLNSLGFSDSDVILVDVGWHGTTQFILQKIQRGMGIEHNTYGIYIGSYKGTKNKVGSDKLNNYLFDEDMESEFEYVTSFFECLILAPHGSTLRYKDENKSVVPVLGDKENATKNLLDMQKGALKFVKDMCGSEIDEAIEFDSSDMCAPFLSLAFHPLQLEQVWIGDMDFKDFYLSKVARPDLLIKYMLKPRKFISDLKHSPWRVGFIKRLFKLPLPYGSLYSLAKRKTKSQRRTK